MSGGDDVSGAGEGLGRGAVGGRGAGGCGALGRAATAGAAAAAPAGASSAAVVPIAVGGAGDELRDGGGLGAGGLGDAGFAGARGPLAALVSMVGGGAGGAGIDESPASGPALHETVTQRRLQSKLRRNRSHPGMSVEAGALVEALELHDGTSGGRMLIRMMKNRIAAILTPGNRRHCSKITTQH